MISLGSIVWGTGPKIPIAFAYEKQRSGANMQYRVQVTISAITGSHYFGYPIYLGLSVNGADVGSVTLKSASPKQWSSAIVYTSNWYTVSNKTSGTTPVAFKMYSGSGSTRNNTYSYSMGVDPAASKVSAPNGTLGTALNLTVTQYNTGFKHAISYKCGSVTGNVVGQTTATTVTWNTSNGNVVALAAQNTVDRTVDVTFTITTYSGTSVIGTDSTTIKMAIPDSVKPSVAVKVEDAAGYLTKYEAYVQGWSKLKITATPTLAYSSPIKTYAITADGKTHHTTPVTTDVVQGKGNLTITAKVTDNRDRTSEPGTANITVLEYSKPSVTTIAYRCNSSGEEDVEGAYMRVGFTSDIASLNGKNSAKYSITYTGASAPITGKGASYTSNPIACDVARVISVEVTVEDDLDHTTKSAVIPIAFTLMDFHSSGEGVALGKVATRKGFDCAMDAYFTGKRVREVGTPVDDGDAVNKAYAFATFYPSTEDTTYSGCYYRVVRGEKEWINPPLMLGEEYRTTERWYGGVVYTKLVDLGNLPGRAGQISVNHGAAAKAVLRVHGVDSNGKTIGYTHSHDLPLTWISANTTQIIVAAGNNEYADHSAMTGHAQIWYVKN